jgi:hypothetical protein
MKVSCVTIRFLDSSLRLSIFLGYEIYVSPVYILTHHSTLRTVLGL